MIQKYIRFAEDQLIKNQNIVFFIQVQRKKTEEEFKNALKEYIQEIKERDEDYNFKRFIFVENINFKEDLNITIFKLVNSIKNR